MTSRLNRRAIAARWPARREVFRLLGFYLGEREARALLNRIHEYKWLEAEKAGFDIWQIPAREPDPLAHAAKRWAGNHFDAWRASKDEDAA